MDGTEDVAGLTAVAINTTSAAKADSPAVGSVNGKAKPIPRPSNSKGARRRQPQPRARKGIAALRRTQSESTPNIAKADRNSDSDSDLPDAQSLLMTPEFKRKPPAKRKKVSGGATIIEPPTLANSKTRATALLKSVSEELPMAKENEADDLGDIQTLRVPGELVLAVFRREYYPARIVARTGKDRYRVEFFDGYKSTLSRSSMFTMYDEKFQTCRLGRFQLVGDEPAIRRANLDAVDLESDFRRDMNVFRDLVRQVEAVKGHLDRLHRCPADELENMAETEYRIATFFGGDASSRRLLANQVSSGFLNRAEFDFLGRLLSRWYGDLPCAAGSRAQDCKDKETAEPREEQVASTVEPSSPGSVLTEGTDATEILSEAAESSTQHIPSASEPEVGQESGPISKHSTDAPDADQQDDSSLALRFVYDVLVPHAIRRMTVNREGCSLEESEQLMRSKNTENQWVEHILAARGISLETWI